MPALLVSKSPPLSGEVTIHGAKNSVLPILAATLLCRTPCVLHNCPDILDVTHTRAILHSLGCASERRGASVYIDPRSCAGHSIPPELAASMRASSLFLGALLARQGEASLSLPGGCPIGARPVDYHLLAFRALGAEVTETDDTIHCRARRLTGAKITLPGPSVGATENAMLAAVGAEGVTVIENAACEPEIVDLAGFLTACGAKIAGAGTGRVTVKGGQPLTGDRIVIMRDGFIQQIGTPQEVFNHPANLFVAGFIGTPQMNFFDATLSKKGDKYVATVQGKDFELPADKQEALKKMDKVPVDIIAGVRPVHIHLSQDGIDAMVDVSELMGSELHLHVNSNGKDVVIVVPTTDIDLDAVHGSHKPVKYSFKPELMHFFDKETEKNLF